MSVMNMDPEGSELPTTKQESVGMSSLTDASGTDTGTMQSKTIHQVHSCELCHRTFLNKKDFLLHQYNHKEKSSFYCAYCFKYFTSESAFRKHNKIHEKKKTKSILCTICKSEFEYVKDLEEHHRKFHLNQKMFRCTSCEATFSWRENLTKHMRMHATPNVSHKCDHCKRTFMDNTSLRLHQCSQKTAPVKEVKPFTCKLCDKSFRFDFSFQAHMNSHEGPVALSAWKTVQTQKMKKKSDIVNKAAERQLKSVLGNSAVPATSTADTCSENTTRQHTVAPSNVENTAQETPALTRMVAPVLTIPWNSKSNNINNSTSLDVTSIHTENHKAPDDLKEIVLEIVNVNELPKAESSQGIQILAQGPPSNGTHMQAISSTSGLAVNIACQAPFVPMSPVVSPDGTIAMEVDPYTGERLGQIQPVPHPQVASIETMHIQPAVPTAIVTNANNQFPAVPDGEFLPCETPPDLDYLDRGSSTIPVENVPPTLSLFSGVAEPKDGTSQESGEGQKKKSKRPLLYDYVMTEETPFKCPQCFKEFRWEISLNIHLQVHMGMTANRHARNKKMKKKQKILCSPHTSKIVSKRASSDEEDVLEQDFSYEGAVVKRKRGRPRKYPPPDDSVEITGVQPPKRKRGRPPKLLRRNSDPVIEHLENTNETVVIRVTRGTKEKQVKREDQERANDDHKHQPTENTSGEPVNIPKHQLIRFYLLRQLKLSRYRGFYPCRFCSKPFSCKASLNMHILRHTGKGSYLCKHCGQKFPDHRTLVLHCLIEEEDEIVTGPHQCTTCCRNCTSAEGLNKHIRRHLATAWPSSRPRVKQGEAAHGSE